MIPISFYGVLTPMFLFTLRGNPSHITCREYTSVKHRDELASEIAYWHTRLS